MTPEERFWSKVAIGAPDECWEWRLHRLDTGYGVGMYRGKQTTAHRHAYAIHAELGRHLATDEEVRHTCDNPPCCNPAHLLLGTHTDNMQDAVTKGRLNQRRPTHCRHGHPFDEQNTYRNSHGHRYCRTCHREREAARRARNRTGISC